MMRTTSLATALALACAAASCSDSTVADRTGASLTLAPPADRTVGPGETCEVDLSIARTGVEGPVEVRFEGLPAGVSVVERNPVIPAGREAATFTLHAENDASPVDEQLVTVTAATDTGMTVSDQFRLRVRGPE